MSFLNDDKAQVGGIIMFVAFFFIVGFVYIVLGGIEQKYVDSNNQFISSSNAIPPIPYSQERYNAMDTLFGYWWAIPIIALFIGIIYAIRNSSSQTTQEVQF